MNREQQCNNLVVFFLVLCCWLVFCSSPPLLLLCALWCACVVWGLHFLPLFDSGLALRPHSISVSAQVKKQNTTSRSTQNGAQNGIHTTSSNYSNLVLFIYMRYICIWYTYLHKLQTGVPSTSYV